MSASYDDFSSQLRFSKEKRLLPLTSEYKPHTGLPDVSSLGQLSKTLIGWFSVIPLDAEDGPVTGCGASAWDAGKWRPPTFSTTKPFSQLASCDASQQTLANFQGVVSQMVCNFRTNVTFCNQLSQWLDCQIVFEGHYDTNKSKSACYLFISTHDRRYSTTVQWKE